VKRSRGFLFKSAPAHDAWSLQHECANKMTRRKTVPLPFLGGISPEEFLSRYWQKKPLLIRDAFPGFEGFLTSTELKRLSTSEDLESRLVTEKRGSWHLQHGPFDLEDFDRLPKSKWSLLVQGVNTISPDAAALLQRFSFIPHARLDDIMVSFAPNLGGVGPHFDSYDVFLLQGSGLKRWAVSSQSDMTLAPGAPLRILQNFTPDEEWLLGPGDMLYLPPHLAHHGVAIGDSMTYSIGFRAPSANELARQFLAFLDDHLDLPGMYRDPNLTLQRHAAEIGSDMIDQVEAMLARIKWRRDDVTRFLGQYLSEPKPHVFFTPPAQPLTAQKFAAAAKKHGLRVSLQTQMLFSGKHLFINGELHSFPGKARATLTRLADNRMLSGGATLPEECHALLYQWYLDGYVSLQE
jgi:50S ribosomal protein L16 3-hydroxylase